jgi:SAM-dependent methyltransferase
MIIERSLMLTVSSAESRPSVWVERFAPLLPAAGEVLDLACGGGRHARLLAALGLRVEAVDRDERALASLRGVAGVSPCQADLESGGWPYPGRLFAGIVVTNYLFRPGVEQLLASLADPGVLIYETFMVGNERFGRPASPQYLLQSQEMLAWARRPGWRVVAFEEGLVDSPRPAMVQRLCAVRGALVARL